MELTTVKIEKPETANFILGQTHFIKTVEDVHEAMVTAVPASLAAGHSFIVFLGQGFFPINVLNAIKMVPEVCHIFCATANPTEVVIAETELGRAILGVVDGFKPKAIEGDEGIAWRKDFLRQIGYKS